MPQPSSLRRSAPGLAIFLAITVLLGMKLGTLHGEGPRSANQPDLPATSTLRPGPLLSDDLTQVPEVSFQAPAARGTSAAANQRKMAQQFTKARKLNARKQDGFMEALLAQRSDLAGLPFVLGEACRLHPERDRVFAVESATLRRDIDLRTDIEPGEGVKLVGDPDAYWKEIRARYEQAERDESFVPSTKRTWKEKVSPSRVAAMMQVLAHEDSATRLEMVRELSRISHADGTKALARLTLFSNEDQIRRAAVQALSVRRERDYTEILLAGFRNPWPTVARRASEALIKLGRSDLVPRLVEILEQPDPRLPVIRQVEGRPVLSPYRRAALLALRELTGKDAAPSAQAWRKLLGQPAAVRNQETP